MQQQLRRKPSCNHTAVRLTGRPRVQKRARRPKQCTCSVVRRNRPVHVPAGTSQRVQERTLAGGIRAPRARRAGMAPIRELPHGPAACNGRITDAANTSASDHTLHSASRIFLRRRGPSKHFRNVALVRKGLAQNCLWLDPGQDGQKGLLGGLFSDRLPVPYDQAAVAREVELRTKSLCLVGVRKIPGPEAIEHAGRTGVCTLHNSHPVLEQQWRAAFEIAPS